jgi:ADP-heptose:LPS heptosyltransferase
MPPEIVKALERQFKRILQAPLALVMSKGDDSGIPLAPLEIRSILILRPDKLGDMVVTVPVIHALKDRFPHLRIEVVASPKNLAAIEGDPCIDAIHLYKKNVFHDLPLIRRLRRRKFDIVYDTICLDSITGLFLTKLIGYRAIKVAARKSGLRRYYDYCRPYSAAGHDHNIDNAFLIFNVLGIKPETISPFYSIYIPPESLVKADRFFGAFPHNNRFQAAVNISAGSRSRTLTPEKYVSIINSIDERRPGIRFILFSVMDDRREAEKIVSMSKAEVYQIPERLSLQDVAAMIRKVDILITPDTSLVHIARLMKMPVVGLYSGHTRNFRSWRPYRQEGGAVVARHISDLHDISPGQVVEEFFRVLGKIKSDSREGAMGT